MFLRLLVLVSAFCRLFAAESEKQPNILLCIADDWGRHASAYGDPVVKTPNFDRVAREGALFWRAFVASPSCTPSRASILTGRAVHQLEDSANLWSTLPRKFSVYPDLLEAAGYVVGLEGKGWSPGDIRAGGRTRNPAGPTTPWEKFFASRDKTKPFCFWLGSSDPHRPYDKGSGVRAGLKAEAVVVPPYWTDTPEVRSDILDYYFEVQRFDQRVGKLLNDLEAAGELENTVVVITSDNGMPFPRAKANLYDAGANVPLAIRWPKRIKGGQDLRAPFTVLTDLAPTFLDAAGVEIPREWTGRTLLPLLTGKESPEARSYAFFERERHAHVRAGNLSYPVRAVRSGDFLYLRNFRPDRWPAGDPVLVHSVGEFGDIDGGPTKEAVLADEKLAPYSTAKRPGEELYDLRSDPHQMRNIAQEPNHAKTKRELAERMHKWMRETKDPRAEKDDDQFDAYPYTGPAGRDRLPRR